MPEQNADTATFLLAAVNDAQDAIRAHDMKAEILAGFVAVVIGGVHALLPMDCTLPGVMGTIAIVLLAVALALLGLVVYPRSAPPVELGGYIPKDVFFQPAEKRALLSVTEMTNRARSADWHHELSFEFLKLSQIRFRKTRWLKPALWLIGLSCLSAVVGLVVERLS